MTIYREPRTSELMKLLLYSVNHNKISLITILSIVDEPSLPDTNEISNSAWLLIVLYADSETYKVSQQFTWDLYYQSPDSPPVLKGVLKNILDVRHPFFIALLCAVLYAGAEDPKITVLYGIKSNSSQI